MQNIDAIAKAAGTSIRKSDKTTIMLTNMSAFAAVNAVYAGFFEAPFMARACFEASALSRGASVEIEAVISLA